jgi:adenylate kinase
MENIRIVILGPQGSGKGTQAQRIAEKYGLMHIDMGSQLRQRQKVDDELGMMMREIISRGDLLPNDIPFSILKEKIQADQGFIIDGFPRNVEQLELLEQISGLDMALYVKISDVESVRRLEKRRVCSKCSKIFIWSEGMDMTCSCGGKIMQREDDTPEAITKRLLLYHEQTELLIREYTDRDILVEINGEQPIDDVFSEICDRIDKKITESKTQQV